MDLKEQIAERLFYDYGPIDASWSTAKQEKWLSIAEKYTKIVESYFRASVKEIEKALELLKFSRENPKASIKGVQIRPPMYISMDGE